MIILLSEIAIVTPAFFWLTFTWESKGWTHGLGSEPVGKEGQGVRPEL